MPDEKGNELADEEELPSTPLHAHGSEREQGEGREEDIEGEMGEDGEPTKTGGATSGGPGGHAEGEDDPSNS